MKIKLPHYTSKDYVIMRWTMLPFVVVLNILIFGKEYFSGLGIFFLATLITSCIMCIDFIICGSIAVTLKRRLPLDTQVKKRLAIMIIVFIIISGLVLYALFSGYELIHFYGYRFNQSGFTLAYICMGILNIFLTLLHEGVARFEKWRASILETEALKKTVKQGQLLGLKSQVNPHFLFNCLNSLSSLINEPGNDAEVFLNEMTKVYRYMLRNDEDLLVSLKKELIFIESYYVLLKARYGDAIVLTIHVSKEAENCLLPPLSLQAIFENALSRNIIQKTSPLKISIEAIDSRQLIIKNNIQLKTVTNAFDYESGLDNLVSKFRLLNQGDLIIADTANERIIQLPLINNEAEVMA